MKDKFGPEYVVRVYDAKTGMEGFLVIDNTALGPGKGGIRMTANVTVGEVARLARTMTWKNALAGIPFGGAKAGLVIKGETGDAKKKLVESFALALKPFIPKKYIAGPDVNSGEREMQWFAEALKTWKAATGKPANFCSENKCGLPHELGSTGFGVARTTAIALRLAGIDIKRATVAIHGFGNVGTFTYKFLTELGAKVTVLADRTCTLVSENGFDRNEIESLIAQRKHLCDYPPQGIKMKPEDFWGIPVDVMIPASVTDVINDSNKNALRAKIIVEGANIPMQESIEEELRSKGVIVVPDFVANAGGVISSYAEYQGMNHEHMFSLVQEKIEKTAAAVLKESIREGKSPRSVALRLARERVEKAMAKRSSSPGPSSTGLEKSKRYT